MRCAYLEIFEKKRGKTKNFAMYKEQISRVKPC